MRTIETHFNGEDMARVIAAFRPELHHNFPENYPAENRRMTDILANPSNPVNLRTADSIVTAMGCPHVLANGAVRQVEHNRKDRVTVNGTVPAAPFRKWLERQSRHYRTLTLMYNDLGLDHGIGKRVWTGQAKSIETRLVQEALACKGLELNAVYHKGQVIDIS